MQYRLSRTGAATARAVDLDAVKRHLRIDWDEDDAQLLDLIAAATEWVEVSTGRSLVTTTWRLDIAEFASIELPQPPFIDINYVEYMDTAGELQTLDDASYRVESDSFGPACLSFVGELPSVMADRGNAVQVSYTAGYGESAAAVPANARHALLLLIAHWWENREAVGTVGGHIEAGLSSLLRTLKTGFVAGHGV